MARYRKIDPRIWNDAKFRSLSDSGKLVFLFLLTHPHMTALGAMRATISGLAEELGWGLEAFREWKYLPYPAKWLSSEGWEDSLSATEYKPDEVAVMGAYNSMLSDRGWPGAVAAPYSAARAAAIRAFLGFGQKPGWIDAYFGWLAEKVPSKAGYGFDWAIKEDTYLRAREGNFAALKAAA